MKTSTQAASYRFWGKVEKVNSILLPTFPIIILAYQHRRRGSLSGHLLIFFSE